METTTERIKTVRLYGKLGNEFGRVHHLAVKNAAEAVRALCVLYKGFEQRILEYNGGWAIFYGKENMKLEELTYPSGGDDIRIAPVPAGAKSGGIFAVVVGAALIATGVFAPVGATIAAGAMAFGAAMVVGGLMMMLSPQPKGPDSMDGVENKSSYSFNGPVNTVAQNNPVPLLYGQLTVGGAVISGGVEVV